MSETKKINISKKTRNIIIIAAVVVAVIGIVLAIVLPLTLNRHDGETFTVKLESNGGTAVESIADVKYGELITEPQAPVKTGYVFDGWYKNSNLSGQWNFATDKVKSDITLYAKWSYNATTGLLMILNGNEYTVAGIGNVENVENINIPEVHNGLPVTTIAQNAFKNQTKIKTVFIPDSVKTIRSGAFYNCSNLTEINLPDGLTEIEAETFYQCEKLEKIEIPEGVKSIGDVAFGTCKSITEVKLPASLQTLGEKVFSACSGITKLSVDSRNTFFYSRDNGKEYNCIIAVTSQNGTTVNKLVVGCQTTEIPANTSRAVTVIGEGAFCGCNTLTRIIIPSGITEIEDEAFNGCMLLEAIDIPASVVRVGDYAFSNCEFLTRVTFGEPAEDSELTGIQILGQEAFAHCYSLSPGFNLPASLTSIGAGLLNGCNFEQLTVTYGDDASKLQTIIQADKDGNDIFTKQIEVLGSRGSSTIVTGLAEPDGIE